MKSPLFLFCWFITFTLFAQNIPDVPTPPRLVNDFVNILSATEREALERKLVAFDDSTSNQITIAIVRSLDGYDISEYSFALGRKWGIGQRGKNNGILILWSPSDRKYFIATGYGLEGAVPDAVAGQIGRDYLGNNFRDEQYYRGLDQATTALMQRMRGEYTADPNRRRARDIQSEDSGPPLFLIVIIVLVIIWLFNRRNRGGGNRRNRGGWGGPVFFPYSTFGGSGSRSGSGFGGGGGGFGGFGGGSFGGGGAGGNY
jgi:uncharacterized protein